MTKLDDLGGRAAAHLRAAVSDHLDAHPAPVLRPPRVPRAVVALGVVLVLALAAGVLVNVRPGATHLQTGEASDRGDEADRTRNETGESRPGTEDGSPDSPGARTPGSPGSSESGSQSPLPSGPTGDAPSSPDPGNEPPSNEVWPGACEESVSAGVGEYPEWCVSGYNDHPTPEGHPLLVSICREPRAGDGVLHFPRRQEADFMITTASGREVWRWSKTRPAVAHRHERALRAGACLTWSVVWDERDQSGRRVPPADYRLSVTVQADEIEGRWTQTDQEVPVGESRGSRTTTTTR